MYNNTVMYVNAILAQMSRLNGLGGAGFGGTSTLNAKSNGFLSFSAFAGGGAVKSGDLVMANENGEFEMMGQMGNQPIVANNNQIIAGKRHLDASHGLGKRSRNVGETWLQHGIPTMERGMSSVDGG